MLVSAGLGAAAVVIVVVVVVVAAAFIVVVAVVVAAVVVAAVVAVGFGVYRQRLLDWLAAGLLSCKTPSTGTTTSTVAASV